MKTIVKNKESSTILLDDAVNCCGTIGFWRNGSNHGLVNLNDGKYYANFIYLGATGNFVFSGFTNKRELLEALLDAGYTVVSFDSVKEALSTLASTRTGIG